MFSPGSPYPPSVEVSHVEEVRVPVRVGRVRWRLPDFRPRPDLPVRPGVQETGMAARPDAPRSQRRGGRLHQGHQEVRGRSVPRRQQWQSDLHQRDGVDCGSEEVSRASHKSHRTYRPNGTYGRDHNSALVLISARLEPLALACALEPIAILHNLANLNERDSRDGLFAQQTVRIAG